jgi:hypothetical protein
MNNRLYDVLQKYTGMNDIEITEIASSSDVIHTHVRKPQLLWSIGPNLFTNSFEYAKLKSKEATFYLYEVNLGYSYVTEELINPPIGYKSLLCPGRSTPDPDQDETLPDDIIVPVGRPIKRMSECYHEYDIYKCRDNRPRFILKVMG